MGNKIELLEKITKKKGFKKSDGSINQSKAIQYCVQFTYNNLFGNNAHRNETIDDLKNIILDDSRTTEERAIALKTFANLNIHTGMFI